MERQTGKKPLELQGPEFPELLGYVWLSFLELSSARSQGYNGPNPIGYADIKYWSELTGGSLTPRDIELIFRLDKVYREVVNG